MKAKPLGCFWFWQHIERTIVVFDTNHGFKQAFPINCIQWWFWRNNIENLFLLWQKVSPCNRQIHGDLTRPSRSEAPGLEALGKKRTSDDPLLFYMTCTHVCVFIFLSFCLFVGSSAKERNLRRSIVIHYLHTRVCTHKVRLWWFDTQLSFNRGLIFDWCIGENVGWRELSKILKAKDEIRRFS